MLISIFRKIGHNGMGNMYLKKINLDLTTLDSSNSYISYHYFTHCK